MSTSIGNAPRELVPSQDFPFSSQNRGGRAVPRSQIGGNTQKADGTDGWFGVSAVTHATHQPKPKVSKTQENPHSLPTVYCGMIPVVGQQHAANDIPTFWGVSGNIESFRRYSPRNRRVASALYPHFLHNTAMRKNRRKFQIEFGCSARAWG